MFDMKSSFLQLAKLKFPRGGLKMKMRSKDSSFVFQLLRRKTNSVIVIVAYIQYAKQIKTNSKKKMLAKIFARNLCVHFDVNFINGITLII